MAIHAMKVFDFHSKIVKIPNNEVRTEYVNSILASDKREVSKSLKNSADTLEAIWQNRPEQVAETVKQAHFETSYIQYNDENALSYTISLALYAAGNFYTIHREYAGGKGSSPTGRNSLPAGDAGKFIRKDFSLHSEASQILTELVLQADYLAL